MYSPFYIAEQKFLYPNRSMANTKDEIQDRLVYLVANEIETEEQIRSMSLKKLSHNYFPSATVWELLAALEKPIHINTLWDINEQLN